MLHVWSIHHFVSPKVGQMLVDNWYNGAKGCSWSSDQDIFAIRMLQVRETSQFPRCAFGVVGKYDYDAILYKNISIHRYLCNMIAQICIYIYIHIAQERPIPIPSVIPLRCQDFYSRHAWPRVMEGLGHKKGGPKSFQHVLKPTYLQYSSSHFHMTLHISLFWLR